MIVLVGASGSGKSTIQKCMEQKGIKKLVTYTTRPMREGEVDGVDYHFVSDEKFEEMVKAGAFAEHASYRGWHYGTAVENCGLKSTSAALTPAGMRSLKRNGIKHTSVYIDVDRRQRLVQLLKRGDDIEEAYRRSLSDLGQFDKVEDEVDMVIKNEIVTNPETGVMTYKSTPDEIADNIIKFYETMQFDKPARTINCP